MNSQRIGALALLRPHVDRWRTQTLDQTEPEPADVYLDQAVSEAAALCAGGASVKTITVLLDLVAETLNVAAPSVDAIGVYHKILSELPDDLVEASGLELLKTYRFNSFPKPADFTGIVAPWLGRRRILWQVLAGRQSRLAMKARWAASATAKHPPLPPAAPPRIAAGQPAGGPTPDELDALWNEPDPASNKD